MSRFREPSLRPLTLPLAVALGVGLAAALPQNMRLENLLNRTLPQPLTPAVRLVAIDDASLRDYGRIDLWPRELYAAALKTLTEAGAKVIGLDVLLSDTGRRDSPLSRTFSRPNVVLATDPSDPFGHATPAWTSPKGVSALNAPHVVGIDEFQTAYPAQNTRRLAPSFARQVAAAAGADVPLSTVPRVLPYTSPEKILERAISFRDVVNGNVRYADVQGRVVLVGLTASDVGGSTLPDLDGRPVPGVVLQARAVSALLGQPVLRLPLWLTALLCAVCTALVIVLRRLWGFALAVLALVVSVPLWRAGVSFPGVTLSLAAVLATGLVAFERWWTLRRISTQDPLTGFGNRLAFTRVVEHRWGARQTRPFGLLLIEIDELRRVTDTYGRGSSEEVMRDLAEHLQRLKRRGDVLFRWGPEEFAVLLDQVGTQNLPGLLDRYRTQLADLHYRDLPLVANIGAAVTGADLAAPTDLIERASRERYRMKFRREQQSVWEE